MDGLRGRAGGRRAHHRGTPLLFEVSSLSWEDPILHEHGDRARLVRRAQERTRRVVRGRYWPRLHDLDGHDQIRWVVDLLRARPWTTSAWISLTIPGEPTDGLPTLTALSFRIRGYRLMMTAMFRSQNVHRGYLMYIPLHEVQTGVAEELGLYGAAAGVRGRPAHPRDGRRARGDRARRGTGTERGLTDQGEPVRNGSYR